ncbi:MAG: hypothetical protein U5N58_03250 [Actinomycetota bacterium]|nr:hypothetical protein [Actinomycetota bacterium]
MPLTHTVADQGYYVNDYGTQIQKFGQCAASLYRSHSGGRSAFNPEVRLSPGGGTQGGRSCLSRSREAGFWRILKTWKGRRWMPWWKPSGNISFQPWGWILMYGLR